MDSSLIVLLGFSLLVSIFFFLVQPIWAIIECAVSERSNSSKAIWIILTAFFWSMAGFFYALVGTSSKALRYVSIFFALPVIILFGLGAYVYLNDPAGFLEKIEKTIEEALPPEVLEMVLEGLDDPSEFEKKIDMAIEKMDKASREIESGNDLDIESLGKELEKLGKELQDKEPDSGTSDETQDEPEDKKSYNDRSDSE
ncbi:MAG TPA: PLD nuclease N-terminal domain-containing protein [Oligoflexia bacterium]|nr:PLD nuclease N-terminal domain-containing protein [Oligoflexia bacterium]HMP48183.1 PLD nuclease N-terminal domain-containing protein [Oligoflexia bacterium]